MSTLGFGWMRAIRRAGRVAVSVAVFAFAMGVPGGFVHAQTPQAPQGFTVGGNVVHENLPATPFVFAAYAIVWLALLTYVFMLWRRTDRVAREIERVNAQLASRR